MHTHVLPWTDRPLVTRNLVGGEEGIRDAGHLGLEADPEPVLFLEATGEVYRGDSATCSSRTSARDLSYVGQLRGYRDLTEGTNLDLGASYRVRAQLIAVARLPPRRLFGVDATFRWRPLRRAIYHRFIGAHRAHLEPARSAGRPGRRRSAIRERRVPVRARWFGGARYDRSERAADASLRDKGGVAAADLLAERVQPDARPVPPHALCGGRHGQRIAVPVPVFDRRARRAHVF